MTMDLFLDFPTERALTLAERRRLYSRAASVPRGYAAPPGTGPEKQTCKSCKHIVRISLARVYRKCGLMEVNWTGGPKTDIRAGSPACAKWEGPGK